MTSSPTFDPYFQTIIVNYSCACLFPSSLPPFLPLSLPPFLSPSLSPSFLSLTRAIEYWWAGIGSKNLTLFARKKVLESIFRSRRRRQRRRRQSAVGSRHKIEARVHHIKKLLFSLSLNLLIYLLRLEFGAELKVRFKCVGVGVDVGPSLL